MNELMVFNNPEFGKIRTVEVKGEPWLVGKDVALALGYSNTKDALSRHVDPEDRRGSRIPTPSGEQEMTIINESGLYSLVLSSKLPGAKKFKRGAAQHPQDWPLHCKAYDRLSADDGRDPAEQRKGTGGTNPDPACKTVSRHYV